MGKQRLPKPDPRAKRPELKPKNRFRPKDRQTRLRKNMKPGRVCVCLIGPYTSKKVVFLKQLDSGLLMCACLNNGAVRRFPQKWLFCTDSIVHLDHAGIQKNLKDWSDSSFDVLKAEKTEADGGDDEFFNKDAASKTVPAAFQSQVDGMIKAVTDCVKDKYMTMYLKARFTLDSDVGPHKACF